MNPRVRAKIALPPLADLADDLRAANRAAQRRQFVVDLWGTYWFFRCQGFLPRKVAHWPEDVAPWMKRQRQRDIEHTRQRPPRRNVRIVRIGLLTENPVGVLNWPPPPRSDGG